MLVLILIFVGYFFISKSRPEIMDKQTCPKVAQSPPKVEQTLEKTSQNHEQAFRKLDI